MIFLLDILLFVNVVVAYKSFQSIIAPPVLVGGGMFIASVIATTYYTEWSLAGMLLESTLLLAGSTILFTICCLIFKGTNRLKHHLLVEEPNSYIKRILEFVFIIVIFLSFYSFFTKVRLYASYYGSFMEFSMMLGEIREDYRSGMGLKIPSYIMWMGNLSTLFSYFSAWFLSSMIVKKKKKDLFYYILIVQQIVTLFGGLITGAKGAMFDPIMRFVVIYLFVLFSSRSSYRLPAKTVLLILAGFFAVAFGFRGITSMLGRDVEGKKTTDMFAVYMGAEIKNFDIYMHGHDGNLSPKFWGEDIFFNFARDIDPTYYREPREFQQVGNYTLGNVYTQTYSFHKDFGYQGVIILTMLVAYLSMFVYKKVLAGKSIFYLFIYSQMALPLFMSFFSSRFTENVIRLNFVKYAVYLLILLLIYEYLADGAKNRNAIL